MTLVIKVSADYSYYIITWLVPKEAEKPIDGGTKQGKELQVEHIQNINH